MSVLSPVLFNTLRARNLHFPFRKSQGPRFESVRFAFTLFVSTSDHAPPFFDTFIMYLEVSRVIFSFESSILRGGLVELRVIEICRVSVRVQHMGFRWA